ncbi:2-dehydro-3-deoxygalactonokinase [Celeribacter arenosi]|uniref:2-dehydro-3-deoxygalactonokinase n=1 Tax=Celeribacter arenosi TaxID=792649 RepID=A0ABP7KBJ6_9RHOB
MTNPCPENDWIAVDWGTSNLRVWVMRGTAIVERLDADQGMGSIAPKDFEPVLLSLISPFLGPHKTPVVICGMAGSRQGWAEAPYTSVPCGPPGLRHAVRVATKDPRLSVSILPGIKQDAPADVMRGEETQILGYLAKNPDFSGVICLPGTHSKWAQISDGKIEHFRTFMTGELFALLSKSSILRFSVGSDVDVDAFETAVSDMIRRPEDFNADLFGLRAGTLIGDLSGDEAMGRLSGLMVGCELAGARAYWQNQNVALIGASQIVKLYARALATQGVTADIASGEDSVLAGLSAAQHSLEDQI